MRQQREPYRGEEPADVRRGTVVSHLPSAQEKKLGEAVEHPGAGLVHRHHDALALLLRVFLQP